MKAAHNNDLPLDARQLNAFVTLVETGSFTETARRLSLTQSAISHSLRALEAETGCRLLAKVGGVIVPSEAGEALLFHARLGLKEFGKAREVLEQLKSWGARRLRVGGTAFVNQRFLPGALVELRRHYPRLLVGVKTISPGREADALRGGELDCVIGEEPFGIGELDFTPLFRGDLQVVVPSSHRWASRQQVPVAELAREAWLLPERPSDTRALIERYFLRDKTTLNCVAEVETLETIKELIKAGFGIGILPSWMVEEEISQGSLRALPPGGRELRQTWGLLRWKGRPMDVVEATFRTLCVKAAKNFAGE
jgi:DNA-binding transcriptional LysR family regulator